MYRPSTFKSSTTISMTNSHVSGECRTVHSPGLNTPLPANLIGTVVILRLKAYRENCPLSRFLPLPGWRSAIPSWAETSISKARRKRIWRRESHRLPTTVLFGQRHGSHKHSPCNVGPERRLLAFPEDESSTSGLSIWQTCQAYGLSSMMAIRSMVSFPQSWVFFSERFKPVSATAFFLCGLIAKKALGRPFEPAW